MGTESLVSPALKDLLAKELQALKVNNKSAKEKEYLDGIEETFCGSFINLCFKISELGLSPKQVEHLLEKDERFIFEIDEFICGKAKWRARVQITLCVATLIPFLVVKFVAEESEKPNYWDYWEKRKILKRAYGQDYFPIASLKKYFNDLGQRMQYK